MKKNIALGILSIITLSSVLFTFLRGRELDSLKIQVQEHRTMSERMRRDAETLQMLAQNQQQIAEQFRLEAERKLAACNGQTHPASFASLQNPLVDSLNRLVQKQRWIMEQNAQMARQRQREAEIQQQAIEQARVEMEKRLADCLR